MYRILLADDEGIMLESLKKIIETEYGNECEIHCAKSGRVVVEMAQAYSPDICFMDIQMPTMNGYEAARAIRAASRSDAVRIPIIAITSNAFSEDVKMALAAGMNAHIAKPFELKLLKKIIRQWLN